MGISDPKFQRRCQQHQVQLVLALCQLPLIEPDFLAKCLLLEREDKKVVISAGSTKRLLTHTSEQPSLWAKVGLTV